MPEDQLVWTDGRETPSMPLTSVKALFNEPNTIKLLLECFFTELKQCLCRHKTDVIQIK